MLAESASAIPSSKPSSIWASMNCWFTPSFLFLLLNLVIVTIAFTSTTPSDQKARTPTAAKPPTAASLLHRLKSISFHNHLRSQEPPNHHNKPNPDSDSDSDSYTHQVLDTHSHYFFQDLKIPAHFESDYFGPSRTEKAGEEPIEQQSMEEVYSKMTTVAVHFGRTMSDTEPASGVLLSKLPAKMRKSASLKSAFGHFEEEEIVETVRERGKAQMTDDEEVDSKADDFINRFKQQLKLQRMDSIGKRKC